MKEKQGMGLLGRMMAVAGLFFQAPSMFSQVAETKPSFEVALIKPSLPGTRTNITVQPGGRLVLSGIQLRLMIAAAYHLSDYQMVGAKDWVVNDQWNIEAKTADGTVDPPPNKAPYLGVSDIMATRLRALLEDRFQLKTHRERREMRVYALTVSEHGSKLQAVDPPTPATAQLPAPPVSAGGTQPAPRPGTVLTGPGSILASAISMEQIVLLLGRLMDYPVIDTTGLAGNFNVRMQFDPQSAPRTALSGAPPAVSDPVGPSLLSAIQEQLGLKLELKREPVEVFVIDSVQRPSEN